MPAISDPSDLTSPTDSTMGANTTMNDMTDEFRRDMLVAVVGTGEKVSTLADQRIQGHGRLLVLLTHRMPAGEYVEDKFKWWPPKPVTPMTEQGREMACKYKVGSTRRWMQKGPDIVELKDDEEYEIEAHGRGLRVLSEGNVVWEVSATTLIVDEATDVTDQDLSIVTGYFSTVCIPDATCVFSSIALMVWLFAVGFCFNDYEKEDGLPYFRMWNAAIIGFVWGMLCGPMVWGAPAVGIGDRSFTGLAQGAFINSAVYSALTIVPIDGANTLTSFLVTVLSVNAISFSVNIPMHFYRVAQPGFKLGPGETEPEHWKIMGCTFAWPRYWKWAAAGIILSFGGWICNYVVGAVYVVVVGAGYGNLANIMLPWIVTGVESMVVAMYQLTCVMFQFQQRPSGDTVWVGLVGGLATTHVFGETVKLVSMVSGAAFCEDNPNGLKWPSVGSCDPYGWVVSLAIGLFITVSARVGWSRYLVGRFFRCVGLRSMAAWFGPTATTKLHDETKYHCGYARFTIPASVVIANIITGKEVVLFNTPATWCCIAAFIVELLEDAIVGSEVVPYPPSPQPDYYMKLHNCHPYQLYAFGSDAQKDGSSRKSSGRKSITPPLDRLRSDGDCFPRSLLLHGAREWDVSFTLALTGLCAAYALFLFQLLLGAGYFHGVCPLPLPEVDRFKEAALWPIPLVSGCRYSP